MKIVYFTLIVLALMACNKTEEYKVYDDHLSFKMTELGDGQKPQKGEIILLNILIKNLRGDTVHYVPKYNYFHTISNHYLDSLWLNFEVGDRILLKVDKRKLLGYLNFQKLKEVKEEKVIVNVKLLNSVPEGDAGEMIQEAISLREVEEQLNIKNYLEKSSIDFVKKDGIYLYKDTITEGEEIKYGSQVSIHYKGRFLDGYTFDNTYIKEITPSFTFGQKYQLIDGIYKGISGMREGERVKLILPSRHAFGGDGSLAAIVPPYTAVIYEVNIVKVIN